MGIMTCFGLILKSGGIDGDTSSFFLRCFIDLAVLHILGSVFRGEIFSDCGCQGCLTMIDVSDCTN